MSDPSVLSHQNVPDPNVFAVQYCTYCIRVELFFLRKKRTLGNLCQICWDPNSKISLFKIVLFLGTGPQTILTANLNSAKKSKIKQGGMSSLIF